MINITDKKGCCGCQACVQICPKQCISFDEDNEGFRYPKVDLDRCINCSLCERTCPIINTGVGRRPKLVYASKNKDEGIRLKSSSGGIFTLLAEKTIYEGGVVFGARFDQEWNVVFDYAETIEDISKFRGSKYVQAYVGNAFKDAKRFLDSGRQVLFSGVPCQIKALKLFLRRDYDNLITVDLACHGVPSPKVWRKYLEDITTGEINQISSINFREKNDFGWRNYGLVIKSKSHDECHITSSIAVNNPFFRAFIGNLIIRPSCFRCMSKNGTSNSDITLADYWGIDNIAQDFNDDKGVSLVLINTERGQKYFPLEYTDSIITNYDDAYRYNKGLHTVNEVNPKRQKFFKNINMSNNTAVLLTKALHVSLFQRILIKIKNLIFVKK